MMPALQLFDELHAEEYAALKASIATKGLMVPIATDQHGTILDGYHRARACAELGIKPRYEVFDCADDRERHVRALTMNLHRRQLTREQKAKAVEQLRALGYTLEQVAQHTGMPTSTVHDLEQLSEAGKLPERIVGKDGKARPTRYKPRQTVVYAKNPQEAQRVQVALTQLGTHNAPGTVMDLRRVERVAREAHAEARRAQPVPPRASTGPQILHGDFREVLAHLPDHSVDVIITDPPYNRKALPLLLSLSAHAARLLKPGGTLAVLYGHTHLFYVEALLGAHLTYSGCCGCWLAQGQQVRLYTPRIAPGWKPVLFFQERSAPPAEWLHNAVFVATGDDKTHHRWGQNYDGIAQMVERLSRPGDLVCDPFLGGGTVALACQNLSRRFVGCDIDAAAVHTTLERLEQATEGR